MRFIDSSSALDTYLYYSRQDVQEGFAFHVNAFVQHYQLIYKRKRIEVYFNKSLIFNKNLIFKVVY